MLTSLVDKSLVSVEPTERDTRYRLLESMRQYGRERLAEAGEIGEVAAKHAAAYATLSEQLEQDHDELPYREWTAKVECEIDNIRAALTWAFSSAGDRALGSRIAATLRRTFTPFVPAEARRWLKSALDVPDDGSQPLVRARLELADAHISSALSAHNPARAAAQRALALFEAAGDRRGCADAQRWAGRSLIFIGEIDEGQAVLREALATYTAIGYRRTGGVLRDLASARAAAGDADGARELFAKALHAFEYEQHEGNITITAGMLAEAEFQTGDVAAAVRYAEEALTASQTLNGSITIWISGNLTAFLIALDRFAEARRRAADALRGALELQLEVDVVVLLQHLAAVFALEPDAGGTAPSERVDLAARLIGFVDKRMAELDMTREFTEAREYERAHAALVAAGGEQHVASLIARGASLREDRAVELALVAAERAADGVEAPTMVR